MSNPDDDTDVHSGLNDDAEMERTSHRVPEPNSLLLAARPARSAANPRGGRSLARPRRSDDVFRVVRGEHGTYLAV